MSAEHYDETESELSSMERAAPSNDQHAIRKLQQEVNSLQQILKKLTGIEAGGDIDGIPWLAIQLYPTAEPGFIIRGQLKASGISAASQTADKETQAGDDEDTLGDQLGGRRAQHSIVEKLPLTSLPDVFSTLDATSHKSPDYLKHCRDFIHKYIAFPHPKRAPKIVVPNTEAGRYFTGSWTLGFDAPIPELSGRWEFLTTGEGSAQELAIINFGSQDDGVPHNPKPTADEIFQLRARQLALELSPTADDIEIVWVPNTIVDDTGPKSTEANGTEANASEANGLEAKATEAKATEAKATATKSKGTKRKRKIERKAAPREVKRFDTPIESEPPPQRRVEITTTVDPVTGRARTWGVEVGGSKGFEDSYQDAIERGQQLANLPEAAGPRRSARARQPTAARQAAPPAQRGRAAPQKTAGSEVDDLPPMGRRSGLHPLDTSSESSESSKTAHEEATKPSKKRGREEEESEPAAGSKAKRVRRNITPKTPPPPPHDDLESESDSDILVVSAKNRSRSMPAASSFDPPGRLSSSYVDENGREHNFRDVFNQQRVDPSARDSDDRRIDEEEEDDDDDEGGD